MIERYSDWKEMVADIYYELAFKMERFPFILKCFFLSHDERFGYPENYEPPYCERCGKPNPEDDWNIPMIKENARWFFVELIERIKGK